MNNPRLIFGHLRPPSGLLSIQHFGSIRNSTRFFAKIFPGTPSEIPSCISFRSSSTYSTRNTFRNHSNDFSTDSSGNLSRDSTSGFFMDSSGDFSEISEVIPLIIHSGIYPGILLKISSDFSQDCSSDSSSDSTRNCSRDYSMYPVLLVHNATSAGQIRA